MFNLLSRNPPVVLYLTQASAYCVAAAFPARSPAGVMLRSRPPDRVVLPTSRPCLTGSIALGHMLVPAHGGIWALQNYQIRWASTLVAHHTLWMEPCKERHDSPQIAS